MAKVARCTYPLGTHDLLQGEAQVELLAEAATSLALLGRARVLCIDVAVIARLYLGGTLLFGLGLRLGRAVPTPGLSATRKAVFLRLELTSQTSILVLYH